MSNDTPKMRNGFTKTLSNSFSEFQLPRRLTLHQSEVITGFFDLQRLDKKDDKSLRDFYEKYHEKGVLSKLINEAFDMEIASEGIDMLRSNNIGLLLFSRFWYNDDGLEYIKNILYATFKKVQKIKLKKIPSGEDLLNYRSESNDKFIANYEKQILTLSKVLFNQIIHSKATFPSESRNILSKLYSELVKCDQKNRTLGLLFNDTTTIRFGSFFFLRLICPVLSNPQFYGVGDLVNPGHKATLIRIGKVLQRIGNFVPANTFSDSICTDEIDIFVEDSIQKMMAFVTSLFHERSFD